MPAKKSTFQTNGQKKNPGDTTVPQGQPLRLLACHTISAKSNEPIFFRSTFLIFDQKSTFSKRRNPQPNYN